MHDYWKTNEGGRYYPISNTYDKTKNLGIIKFKKPLDKIPGISGHPFLHTQTNLLTLKLPTTIASIGRGAFWGCGNLEYINFKDLINLETIERDWICGTNLTKIDLRNTKLTRIDGFVFGREWSEELFINYEYILLPETIQHVSANAFCDLFVKSGTIKTLMTPTLTPSGNYWIEDQVTENLIINKFDGIGHLHSFNGDVIIWVPDEWYDKYIEYYTGNTDYYNWEDIVRILRKYSDGVPEF